MNPARKLSILITASLTCLFLVGSAVGQEYLFEAEINGANEVPPTEAPQTGLVTLILNAEQTEASYVIEYDALPDETGAHFHLAPPGTNGAVVHGLPAGNPKIGVWEISPEHVEALFEGNIYVNIHSSEYPGGAIRGNLESYVVPVEITSWAAIKSMFR